MSDAPREIGPFEILALLGRGGMGVVYRARHAASGEVVALKTVRVPDPDLVSGIRREVRALSRLDHPGIVRIVAEGIHEGIPWYAMQHLSGQTLSRHAATDACVAPTLPLEAPARPGTAAEPRARATPRFSRGHALTLVRRLCSPLAYLHGEGFVHKDLKPDNVLVLGSGAPVILDFGLTDPFNAAREELSVSSAAVGTAPYMAPEQAVAGRLDARADLYSLGCILFELLTGRPPFLGDPAAILFQHLTVVPPKASSLAPDVPAGVDAIVARLLAKEPADRFGYASDVASALARAGAENGVYGGAPRGRTYLYHPGFAGRDDEIRIVKSALRSPQSAYRAVLLVGESGAGKTRLASEVARRIADAGQMVMAGQCASDDPAPLRGFQGILRTIGDGCRGGGQKEVERVLGPHAKLLSAFEPSLATLPGVPEQPDPPSLPEAASRARLLHALQKVLGAVEEGGLLLVIDDVQWADDLTLLATESLLDGKAAVRILALCREEEETDGIRALAGHPCAARPRGTPLRERDRRRLQEHAGRRRSRAVGGRAG
ncbi:MAG: protein kinase [Acidobacteriota bacterium]